MYKITVVVSVSWLAHSIYKKKYKGEKSGKNVKKKWFRGLFMVCVSCSRHPGYKKYIYMKKDYGARKVVRTPQLWKKLYKWEKKMDPEIKKKNILGKKNHGAHKLAWTLQLKYIYI